MELCDYGSLDDYNKKCGELFLNSKGNFILICSLCANKYHAFDEYLEHLMEKHLRFKENVVEFETEVEQDIEEKILNAITAEETETTFKKHPDLDTLEETALTCAKFEEDLSLDIITEVYNEEISDLETPYDYQDEFVEPEPFANQSRVECTIKEYNLQQEDEMENRQVANKRSNDKRRYKCPQCDYCCNDKSNLFGHLNRHSSNKRYQCTECEKRFHTRTELKAHIRRHTGEKPFLCTECGLSFFTSGILTAHVKRLHQNLKEKECSFCHKKFFDAVSLQNHIRVHSGERPFKCQLCPSSFKRNNALSSHMNMHENKKKYNCEFCPAKFNQKCNLNAHRKNKHLVAVESN